MYDMLMLGPIDSLMNGNNMKRTMNSDSEDEVVFSIKKKKKLVISDEEETSNSGDTLAKHYSASSEERSYANAEIISTKVNHRCHSEDEDDMPLQSISALNTSAENLKENSLHPIVSEEEQDDDDDVPLFKLSSLSDQRCEMVSQEEQKNPFVTEEGKDDDDDDEVPLFELRSHSDKQIKINFREETKNDSQTDVDQNLPSKARVSKKEKEKKGKGALNNDGVRPQKTKKEKKLKQELFVKEKKTSLHPIVSEEEQDDDDDVPLFKLSSLGDQRIKMVSQKEQRNKNSLHPIVSEEELDDDDDDVPLFKLSSLSDQRCEMVSQEEQKNPFVTGEGKDDDDDDEVPLFKLRSHSDEQIKINFQEETKNGSQTDVDQSLPNKARVSKKEKEKKSKGALNNDGVRPQKTKKERKPKQELFVKEKKSSLHPSVSEEEQDDDDEVPLFKLSSLYYQRMKMVS